jgi:hypothetical protein
MVLKIFEDFIAAALAHLPIYFYLLFFRFTAWSTSLCFIYSLVGSATLLYLLSGCYIWPPLYASLAGEETISLYLFTLCLLYL